MSFITEGEAKVYHKQIEVNKKGQQEQSEVFYNPVQIFNRDLSVLVTKFYLKQLREKEIIDHGGIVVDALSASGLRAIRYSKEIPDIKRVYSNDISDSACRLIGKNIALNNCNNITQTQMDTNDFFKLSYDKFTEGNLDYQFNVVDLDPYGSGIPFLDQCIKASHTPTLICCTFTDLKVLSGPDFEKCYYYYGVNKSKTGSLHENALRIVLYSANAIANKYCKYIVPKLSVYSDFYVRIFFEVNRSKVECQRSIQKTGMVYNCETCTNFHIQPFARFKEDKTSLIHKKNQQHIIKQNTLKIPSAICDQCASFYHPNGPVWLAPINDYDFVESLFEFSKSQTHLHSIKKIQGILYGVIQEKTFKDYPYTYMLPKIAKFLRLSLPKNHILLQGFESLNYSFTDGYIEKNTIRTNAPQEVVFDVLRSWKKQSTNEEGYLKHIVKDSPAYNALTKEITYKPDFTFPVKKREQKMALFFPNPEPEWGPKKAAKRKILVDEEITQKKSKIN